MPLISSRDKEPGGRIMNFRMAARILLLLACPAALSGCTLVQLRSETREFYDATVLAGRVSVSGDWRGPVIVAAVTNAQGRRVIAHQTLLHEPGSFELIVPDGVYSLVAYGDADGNGLPDDENPAGILPSSVTVEGSRLISLLDFMLAESMVDSVRRALPRDRGGPRPLHSTQIGAIADLSAPAFSAEHGRQGYWSPLETFRSTGGNIYFTEPYDPGRIPVLFVHGASGSAQDWRTFLETLDRSRYQAWIFQYPSGAPLESMAYLLYWKLLNAQLRYRFERLHIVAHSMGGLVVRRFLVDHGAQFPQISQFVTISTPWGGAALATVGVEHSPAVVPSWRDMQPKGVFLKRLFERPMPEWISHSLLFGHRAGLNLVRSGSDGTVTLASQLRHEAQVAARVILGFNEDHVSILSAPQVIQHVARLLDAHVGGRVSEGGRLQIALSFPDERRAGGVPVLELSRSPDGASAAESSLDPVMYPIPATDGPHEVGELEPGTYELRLSVPGFRTIPERAYAEVAKSGLVRVTFDLAPAAALAGSVAPATNAITHPAGSYFSSEHILSIREIALEGAGQRRSLVPRRPERNSHGGKELRPGDDAVGTVFRFVDLPAGDYVLRITADGYLPHESHHDVEPGVVTPDVPITLWPCERRRRDHASATTPHAQINESAARSCRTGNPPPSCTPRSPHRARTRSESRRTLAQARLLPPARRSPCTSA